jgi:hypothetical protein
MKTETKLKKLIEHYKDREEVARQLCCTQRFVRGIIAGKYVPSDKFAKLVDCVYRQAMWAKE